jgi:hypothetical protein
LKLLVRGEEGSDTPASLHILSTGTFPPSTADKMLEALHVRESYSYVVTWGEMIGEYATQSKYTIPTFKNFGCVENGRSEPGNVVWNVRECVQLPFNDDPLWVYQPPEVKDVVNEHLNVSLQ